MSVLLLATFDTKQEETEYLINGLTLHGVPVDPVDISLLAQGEQWSGAEKVAAMARAAKRAIAAIADLPRSERQMVVALGGGTGGQIALEVLAALPVHMIKVMVTTLPFDPRYVIADSAIVLVPTVADLCGLNATTRIALDRAVAITKGLYQAPVARDPGMTRTSVGVTALGVTGPGTDALRHALIAQGQEVTVFHANGFGGAAFARWSRFGAFHAVVDYTPHELTRCYVAGVHVDMPDRFTAMGHLPRVVLPGGVNFIGMGQKSLMRQDYMTRPFYSHSPLFTHVKVTPREIAYCARVLGTALQQATAPVRVLIPMGGFSSEDRPGGAIEDADLRAVFADTLEGYVPLSRLDSHINDASTAHAAADALQHIVKDTA